MKNSKKNANSAGQSTIAQKASHKHDANLQKNSTLYFQIGLILCLLCTYGLFEMEFQDKKITPDIVSIDEITTIDVAYNYQVEEVKVKQKEPKVDRSTKLTDVYKVTNKETPELETEIFTEPTEPTSNPVAPGDIKTEEPLVEVFVPFKDVQSVPVYPGCEKKKTNAAKRKCMSDKINKLVSRKFNPNIAEGYGISGLQKIHTQFTVDKHGNITDVKIRGPHPALEKEAQRVINKIPNMTPGYQRDMPVGVIYNLPIKFVARN